MTASRRTAPASRSSLGRLDEAEEAYGRALELCPATPAALADLSTMRLHQQRYEEALDLSSTATDLDPDATAWANRGTPSLLHLGRREEALQSLDRALALDPYHRATRRTPERRSCRSRLTR